MAKKLTSAKARKILHDKSVHGHPLTEQQRKFFGAIAGGAKPYKAEEGGWLDKYDGAQSGKKIIPRMDNRSTGDIASYYPAIRRMREQPKIDETKVEVEKKRKQKLIEEISRRSVENQPTIGPARPDYRTDREKVAQRDEMARREAMRNSALAQTFGSFTPSGSPDAGVIGAETFVNMNPLITGPFLSGTRLYGQASGQNPYGFGESTSGNVLGAIGVLGDVAFLRSTVPSGTASQIGRYITTETPVRNTYKLNPFAEKLKDANKSYRVVGRDAYEDFVKTGGVRSVTPMPTPGMSFAERIQQRPTAFPSFQKGFADLRYLPEEGGVVFETSLPTFRRGDINPVTGQRIKGRHYAHRVIDPKTGKTVTNIPASDVNVYEGTPDWLRGYRPINVSEAAPTSGISNIFRSVEGYGSTFNPLNRLKSGAMSQLAGVSLGIEEGLLSLLSKGKGRSLSEMFPISRFAKRAASQESQIANIEGEKFVRDWVYDKQGVIRPEVKSKISNIMFSKDSPYAGGYINNYANLAEQTNPLFTTPNEIVNTRFNSVLNNPSLTNTEKVRILRNRDRAVGVNFAGFYEPASYTFENMGAYNFPYSSKLSTAIHEGAHTMQQLGAKGSVGDVGFGNILAKYDPKYKYYVPNTETEIGRQFAEVMKKPRKGFNNWATSPNELHSELMPARQKLVKMYTDAGKSYEDALDLVRNPSDRNLDWMIKEQDLNRFFKRGVSKEKKREMLRLLPAAIPAVGAIGAMGEEEEQQRDGGWLDKYEQGGMVLKQKTHDNYGKKPNPNNPDVSLPPGFKGWAYNTKGRNYSPAWGGQFKDGGNIQPAMAGANQTVPMAQLGDSVKPIPMQLAMGGSLPGSVGFMYARTQSPAPSNGPYAKKTKASAQNGMEMKYYQEGLDFKPKTISQDGTVIDPDGYWNPENVGNPVIIPSNIITMEGVDQPLIGISDEGDIQYMEPGEDYEFEGDYVTEYPVAKKGISVNNADAQPVKKLDQLLNFTNYNKPTKGGWLDKYN